jgi:PKD repeat protein
MKIFLIISLLMVFGFINATIINIPAEHTTFYSAITTSVDGDTILVQPGTYLENINYAGKNITIGSLYLTTQDTSYISQTILDGFQNGSVVTFDSGEDSTAVLTGFSITNGYTTSYGGGIYCTSSNPTLTNLKITGNFSSYQGGGICCYYSNPFMYNVEIFGNIAENGDGGGIYCNLSNPRLVHCNISNNTTYQWGGGISCYNSNPILNNVIVSANNANIGGGIVLYQISNPMIENVMIFDNVASGSSDSNGGGIYCANNSDPLLINVTIYNNEAFSYGNAIYIKELCNLTLINSIIYNNQSPQIFFDDSSMNNSISVSYSDIQDGEIGIEHNGNTINWGLGNLSENPLFTDPENYDFHLHTNSPCIDTGHPDLDGDGIAWLTDPDDQDQDGSRMDMGAYYYDQTPYFPIVDFSVNQNSGSIYTLFTFNDLSSTGLTGSPIANWSWDFDNDGLEDSNEQNPSYTYNTPGNHTVSLSVMSDGHENTIIKENYIIISEVINVPSDYLTIQDAIDASTNGATIIVEPNIYYENINFYGKRIIVASKFLETQDSVFISQTIIDGSQNGTVVTFENEEDSSTYLIGFTIQNGFALNAGGILCALNANPNLLNLIISNNYALDYAGGIFCDNSNPTLDKVIITNNIADYDGGTDGGGGIFCFNGSPIISNSIISNNSANNGGGIHCNNSNPLLSNVTLATNIASSGGAIFCRSGSNPNVTNSILYFNNPQEIEFYGAGVSNTIAISHSNIEGGLSSIVTNGNGSVIWLNGNMNSDPLFIDSINGDYHLQAISPCIDTGDPSSPLDPDGTIADMGAYYHDQRVPIAEFVVNDTIGCKYTMFEFSDQSTIGTMGNSIDSWSWDFDNDGSVDSNEQNPVYTYSTPGIYTVSLRVTDGEFENTIVKEDYIQVTHIINIPLNYQTIQEGLDNAQFADTILVQPGTYYENITWPSENGITLQGVSAENTIIDGNQQGNVIFMWNNQIDTLTVIKNLSLINGLAQTGANYFNQKGGGISCIEASPKLVDLIIDNNATIENSQGGGVYCSYSNMILQNVLITNNISDFGGGLFCFDSNLILSEVIIQNNNAMIRSGGIYCWQSNPLLINSIISDNVGGQGDGLHLTEDCSATVINTTIIDNGEYGVYCKVNSHINLINSISWDNGIYEIYYQDDLNPNSATIAHSTIKNGYTGIQTNNNGTINWLEGNIEVNPMFSDQSNRDYHLSDYSLCIAAGIDSLEINSNWYYSPDIDLDGNLRSNPEGTNPDMGAYESILSEPIDAEIITNEILPEPGVITINETESIDFSFSGYDPNGSNLDYSWEIDGTLVSIDSTYLFTTDLNSAGDYIVTLQVNDNFGTMETINTNNKPRRSEIVIDTARNYILFTWDVTVIDVDQNIIVNDLSFADYNGSIWQTLEQTINETDSLFFFINAYDPDGNNLDYSWELDGSTVSADSTYLYITDFDSGGMHLVSLDVTDNFSSERQTKDSSRNILNYTWSITVNEVDQNIIVTEIQPEPGQITINETDTINFLITAYDPDGNTLEYSWQVDGIEQSIMSTYDFTTNYSSAGVNIVTLDVTDNFIDHSIYYEWDVIVIDVDQVITVTNIQPEPGTITIDEMDNINFLIEAYDPDGDNLDYLWELDGEEVSTDSTYLFTTDYSSTGEYVVTLEVTDNFETERVSRDFSRNILNYSWDVIVNDVDQSVVVVELVPPEGSITIDEEDIINFSIDAYDPDGNSLDYLWELDGENVSTESTYDFVTDENSSGDYVVSLSITDNYGSRDVQDFNWDVHINDTMSTPYSFVPQITRLYSNNPNPFNPLTSIMFDIKELEKGILSIYNIKGQLIESNQFDSGQHNYTWDASKQSSGIYLYKLETESVIQTRKMLLLK